MPELQLLRPDHAAAVLAFELENRAFFATTISDRGDAYFEHFTDRHSALLAEHVAGTGAFYVLVDDDSFVLGRFNLIFESEHTARLGYRVAERSCGRGVATATGPADPADIGGKEGTWYQLTLPNAVVASRPW